MSVTFSTIRQISSIIDNDDNNNNDDDDDDDDEYNNSGSSTNNNINDSTQLSFTMDLTHSISPSARALSTVNDSSLQLKLQAFAHSLQLVTRNTFHKPSSISPTDASPTDVSTASPNASSANGKGNKRKSNPYKSKTKSELTSTSFRISSGKHIHTILEVISIALVDVHKESYGKIKINNKDVQNLTYDTIRDTMSFQADGCVWLGNVDLNWDVKASNKTSRKNYNVPFRVECQAVRTVTSDHSQNDDNDNDTTNDNDINEYIFEQHYCIDFTAVLDETQLQQLPSHYIKAISQTITHLSYDVARALYWLELPDFKQGCKGETFKSIYQLNAKIKSGAFATVCLTTHRQSRKRVAVKCVQRKNLPPSDDVAIHSEVTILTTLTHPHICPILDFFMEDECYYIVMELMEGGDVFDRIGQLQHYDERIARDLTYKMLKAIQYCHDTHHIAHCDLKPKNLLLCKADDDANVMLADFGFATHVFKPQSLTKQCGTPYFVAPEILLRQSYDTKADMWSVGVILYCILSGQLPFTGRRHLELFKAIIAGDFTFDDDENDKNGSSSTTSSSSSSTSSWKEVSEDAKDLIRRLLVTDPKQRMTAEEALQSKWIRTNGMMLKRRSLISVSTRMKTFNARLKLKTAILCAQSMNRWRIITRNSVSNSNIVVKDGDDDGDDTGDTGEKE